MKSPITWASLLLGLSLTSAATLQHITTPFGPNPTSVGFYIYIPTTLTSNSNPPILVNPHWCHGTAQAAFAGSQWATWADKHGYIVIYPDSPNVADHCWDLSSAEGLTHDGGGDSLGIVSMVRWTIKEYNADASRVFVTGVSSGGMMTNHLVGAYPDVFAAGAAFAGVPFGCYAYPGNNSGVYGWWSDDCAKGRIKHTGEEWKGIVERAYPEYTGWRPKFQTFHGTVDETVDYVNFGEQVKQWTSILGLSETPTRATANTPVSGWTKYEYGTEGRFEAFSAAGVSHGIQNQESTVMSFFQLNCTTGCFSWGQGGQGGSLPSLPSSSTKNSVTSTAGVTSSVKTTLTTTKVTSTTKAAITTTAATVGQTLWGQCGGSGYTGPTVCSTGTCTTYNPYYAQCTPSP
ncbi:Alpha/Beta hydrolase protein [Sordaria brevicollis]|uniref:Carboxylic ester hydrolase n=1 Tax=Sordaria brevicollis TaxID=83679 RepID=A0AAE0NVW4_SORBR|nr:Alpha/Beta hydrolase protein [Sordaria brevicollis]